MRVFISSVRNGLEEERSALPGFITALQHEPVYFEQFTAQNSPSREACLKAVQSADVCLFILGPKYGHRFEDTGQSPTHEEWSVATSRGIPRYVFRKMGVEFEPDQYSLLREIGDYASGVFYSEFSSTPELMTKITETLREAAESDGPLTYTQLDTRPSIEWRSQFQDRRFRVDTLGPMIEVHVIPQSGNSFTSRIFTEIGDSLLDRIRSARIVDSASALQPIRSDDAIIVDIPQERPQSWDQPRTEQVVGVRVAKSGQVSAWGTLPRTPTAAVLDPERAAGQIAAMLRLIGALRLIESPAVAVAAGIDPITMVTVGSFDQIQNSRSASVKMSDSPIQVEPDEGVSLAALDEGAPEVANALIRQLVDAYGRRS